MTVHLRLLRPDDAAQVLAWRNSESVAPYMYSDHKIGPQEHQDWLSSVLKASDRFYWIIEVENEAVGLANVTDIDEDYSRCDWAYYLASPTTRNRGVGACVEYLILRFVFDALRLNKLWCEVFRENARVWALHESFGFRREAELRDHVRKDGAFRDVVGLGLLKSDWPEVKARAESRFEAKGLDWRAMSLVDPRDFSVATAGCEPGWKLASRSGRAPPQHVPRP